MSTIQILPYKESAINNFVETTPGIVSLATLLPPWIVREGKDVLVDAPETDLLIDYSLGLGFGGIKITAKSITVQDPEVHLQAKRISLIANQIFFAGTIDSDRCALGSPKIMVDPSKIERVPLDKKKMPF